MVKGKGCLPTASQTYQHPKALVNTLPRYGHVTLQQGHFMTSSVTHWLDQYNAVPARPLIEDEANYELLKCVATCQLFGRFVVTAHTPSPAGFSRPLAFHQTGRAPVYQTRCCRNGVHLKFK
jgi:hypothetical protein